MKSRATQLSAHHLVDRRLAVTLLEQAPGQRAVQEVDHEDQRCSRHPGMRPESVCCLGADERKKRQIGYAEAALEQLEQLEEREPTAASGKAREPGR